MSVDWQNKFTNISQRIFHLLKTELHSDCAFIVSDKKISCHKLILTMSSPVFETMFYGSMSCEEDINSGILISDIGHDTFQQMISYIYNESIKISSWKNACDLYEASKKYMIYQLTKLCINYLKENVTHCNALQLYEFAKFHSEEEIKKLCLKEIQVNASIVLNNEEALLDISESTLADILQMKRLNISSELELILAVERWATAEAKRQESSEPRNVAFNLVQNLRFLSLTLNEFLAGVVDSDLLIDKEKLDILLRIIQPQLPPMANLLSEKKIKRKERKVRCLAKLAIKEIHEARCDGSEWLTSIFTTNARIDLLGVELKLQISESDDYYMENLVVKVCFANAQVHFTEGTFKQMVASNSTAEIKFNKVITLEPFRKYAIHIFLCSVGIYPLGRHSNLSCNCVNVQIEFVSHSSWERSQPDNMTVLSSIIYDDPAD